LCLLNRIDQDANSFITTPPAIELENHKFPYISAVPKYGVANEEIQFQIMRRHPPLSDHRFLYIAETTPDRETILLKFTRRYSIELHEFCASRHHAPRIVGFQSLPGDWLVIAMQYLSSYVSPSQGDQTIIDCFCEKWIIDLQDLTQAFHKSNLVHGDLREPNILCNEEQLVLLDFHWGGKAGEVYYPDALLNSELTDGRTRTDLMITQDDDNRVLQNTINQLQLRKKRRKIGKGLMFTFTIDLLCNCIIC